MHRQHSNIYSDAAQSAGQDKSFIRDIRGAAVDFGDNCRSLA